MNDNDISDNIKKVHQKFDNNLNEWNKGESRSHIDLKIAGK